MHQIAQVLSLFFGGGGGRGGIYIITGLLGNSMFFIKTLMNADQIYSYLLKLKLNLRIGPNSNYKSTYYGYKNRCFHFV